MKITIEGTPEEIAEWARRVAGAPAPCLLPHYPAQPLAPVYPLPSWPWDGTIYTTPGTTITCADAGRAIVATLHSEDCIARYGKTS